MGRDITQDLSVSKVKWASIHSTQMGRDILGERERLSVIMLQSTLPKWVETELIDLEGKTIALQSTLPKWVETS